MNGIQHMRRGRLANAIQTRAAWLPFGLWFAVLTTVPLARGQSGAELPRSLHQPFSQCVAALKDGRLDEAEKCLTDVLSRGGRASFVYNNLALVYQIRNKHEKAIQQFREAIRLEPGYVAPRIAMGASLMALGKHPEAAQALEKAVRLEPKNLMAREQLVRAYHRTGNFVGVAEQYRALRSLQPEDPEFAYQLGRAYLNLSVWCHQELQSQNPNSARVYQNLAANYRDKGQVPRAATYYRRAIQADPKLPENHLALASIYLEQGKIADARREIDAELAIVPYSAAAIELKKKLEVLPATSPQQ